jgi:general secretion pathway protein I
MKRQRGFTLIEVVMAFSLLAVGLGIAMQIAIGAMRQTRNAAEFTEASLYAQSLVDTLGVAERLEPGQDSGRFGERYRWELIVEPYEVEPVTTSTGSVTGGLVQADMLPTVEMLRLELVVSWERGNNTHEARYVTLRAMTPQPL